MRFEGSSKRSGHGRRRQEPARDNTRAAPCVELLALLSLKQLVSDAAGFGCSFAPRDAPPISRIHAEATPRRGMLPGVSSFHYEARQLNTGIVKWFNATKGYGFIQPESGEADAFVHISAVERAGLRGLNEGQRVKYELVRGRNGKSSAENLALVA